MDGNQTNNLTDICMFVAVQFLAFGTWIIRLGGKVNDNTVRIAELEQKGRERTAALARIDGLLERIDERTHIIMQRMAGGHAD